MPRALVTGGSQRIGRAITTRLADDGWDVVVHYHASAAPAEALCQKYTSKGRIAVALAADLEDEAQTRALAHDAMDALGGLDAVINNASVFEVDDAFTTDRTLWDRHMAVQVRAPFVLSQELALSLGDDARGSVVNIIDQRVFNPSKHLISYSLSKMALWDQTQVLARALAPKVRVNGVGPGPVLPGPRQRQEDFDAQVAQTPLGHAVEPDEIATAVAYLLDATSVTGQMIAVDAGQHMNWAFETDETTPRE